MRLNLILDRIEEGVAVLTDEGTGAYSCSEALLPANAREGDAFVGEIDNGEVISLEKRENPRAGENKRRLRALFNKNKQ